MKRNWLEIIPELKDWLPIPESPDVLASSEGRPAVALGYLTLFWPSFVEHEGMVFMGEETLSDDSKKNIANWLNTTKGDKRAVEAVVNHLHIVDHFGNAQTATEPQVRLLGEILKEMWTCKLAKDFPRKKFVVEFIEGTPEDLVEYQVTFYQPPTKPSKWDWFSKLR